MERREFAPSETTGLRPKDLTTPKYKALQTILSNILERSGITHEKAEEVTRRYINDEVIIFNPEERKLFLQQKVQFNRLDNFEISNINRRPNIKELESRHDELKRKIEDFAGRHNIDLESIRSSF